jgi:hypothetical protein
MPSLANLLVCERIIIDQQQKPSIISVFQSLSVLVPEGQEMPSKSVSFVPWAIFCEWFFSDEETKKQIDQVIEVILPDGSPSGISGRVTFKQFSPHGQGTRAYVNLFGVPIAQTGFIAANVWLESDSVKITETFSYRIKIEHTAKAPLPNEDGLAVPAFSPVEPS